MRDKSLFGEIVIRSSKHAENVATKGLHYLLTQYPSAWITLRRFLKSSGVTLPEKLYFKTQVKSKSQDKSIPDIIGLNIQGSRALIIEAKFWAALTPNQPVEYLKSLNKDITSLMVVLTPSLRFETLWVKLKNACNDEGLKLSDDKQVAEGFRCVNTSEDHIMCLISWQALLGALYNDANTNNERDLMSDVEQLFGLCARMDSQAFTPIHPDELSFAVGRRVQHYADLVDKVLQVLKDRHGASTRNLSTGGSQSTHGRYFILEDFEGLGFFFSYNPRYWARFWETPMWLRVSKLEGSKTWLPPTTQIKDLLSQAFLTDPGKLIFDGNAVSVAIVLQTEVEEGDLITDATKQIVEIANICKLKSD